MEFIKWDSSFETDIKIIDVQHKVLIKKVNQLYEFIEDNSINRIYPLIDELLEFTDYHFETEESLMEEHGYFELHSDDASHHKQQHRSFSANVVDIREGLKKGRPISREGLLSFLNSWLVGHIMSTDKKLAAHIVSRRI